MTQGSIARRYARALFSLGSEEQLVERLEADLERLQQTVAGAGEEARAILSNPTFTVAERQSVLGVLLPGLDLHPISIRFARLLLDKGRFEHLADIRLSYQEMADTAANRLRAEVIASGEMGEHVRLAVAAKLSEATGKQVIVTVRVDESLLGGIIARVGSRVFDASLKTRIENIQRSLLDNAQV